MGQGRRERWRVRKGVQNLIDLAHQAGGPSAILRLRGLAPNATTVQVFKVLNVDLQFVRFVHLDLLNLNSEQICQQVFRASQELQRP